MNMFEPGRRQKFLLTNLGKILQPESATIDQAGLRAYSQVFIANSETLQGGMIKKDSDDDSYQPVSNKAIPTMQASSSIAVTTA